MSGGISVEDIIHQLLYTATLQQIFLEGIPFVSDQTSHKVQIKWLRHDQMLFYSLIDLNAPIHFALLS